MSTPYNKMIERVKPNGDKSHVRDRSQVDGVSLEELRAALLSPCFERAKFTVDDTERSQDEMAARFDTGDVGVIDIAKTLFMQLKRREQRVLKAQEPS